MTSLTEFQRLQPVEYVRQHIEKGIRPDGRTSLASLRTISISSGTIGSADGSAVVKQGETTVVCGVKLELAAPKPEKPDCGFIVPNVDLSPLCHSQFKPGPPSDLAQSASHFVYEVLTNGNVFDLESLCVEKGKWAWVVYVDIVCLNLDGNLLDCALKAALAALRDTRIPEVSVKRPDNAPDKFKLKDENKEDDEDDDNDAGVENIIQVSKTKKNRFKFLCEPLSCTAAVFEDKILLDPTDEEEVLVDSYVTIVLDASASSGSSNDIIHCFKPGGSAMTREQVQQCTLLAKKNVKQIKKAIDSAVPLQNKI